MYGTRITLHKHLHPFFSHPVNTLHISTSEAVTLFQMSLVCQLNLHTGLYREYCTYTVL